jgi:hypothetical protein
MLARAAAFRSRRVARARAALDDPRRVRHRGPVPPLALLLAVLAAQAPAEPRAALLASCADCHPAEAASWERTGMARALEPVRPGELAGLAPVEDPGSGFTYRFEGDGRGARLVEAHPGGGTPWLAAHPLAFAIGAGELDRSFAVKRGGRLFLAQ